MVNPIKVFFVENESAIAESICQQLEFHSNGRLRCVGIALDGDEAIKLMVERKPDVALIDLGLRGSRINGLVVARCIRRVLPKCKAIAFTKTRPYQPVGLAINSGFAGFVLKDEKLDTVVNAIEQVANGGWFFSEGLQRRGDDELPFENFCQLTEREIEVVELAQKGLQNQEIAAYLVIREDTVRQHLSSATGKLGFRNRTELSAFVTKLKDFDLWSLLLESERECPDF